jgi:hypothetical protein
MSSAFLITISEIRLSNGDIPSQLYTTDIGQEGHWYFDGMGSLTEDNTGTALITADLKRFKRAFEGVVNVKWFGAKGDGVTDDTQSIQNAVNYSESEGIDVFFPSGNYLVTNTINLGGTRGIKLVGSNTQYVRIRFNNSVVDKPLFYMSPTSSYCGLENIELIDVIAGTSIGIKAQDQLIPADAQPNWKLIFSKLRITGFKVGYMATTANPLDGTTHSYLDSVSFYHSKFRNCSIAYLNQNIQAVNINFFNTDVENDAVGETYTMIKDEAGFTINVFGGSWIGRGKLYEAYNSAAGINLFQGGKIGFYGTRFEIRGGSVGDLISIPKRNSGSFLDIFMEGCSFGANSQTLSFCNFAGRANLTISNCSVIAGKFVINQYPTIGLTGGDVSGGTAYFGSVNINASSGFTYLKQDSSPYGTYSGNAVSPVMIRDSMRSPNGQFSTDNGFLSLTSGDIMQRGGGIGTTPFGTLIYNSDNPTYGFKSIKMRLPYSATPVSLILFKQPVRFANAIEYKLYFVKDVADWIDPTTLSIGTDGVLIAQSGSTANKCGYMEFPISFNSNYLAPTFYFQSGFGKWLEGRLYFEHSGSIENFGGFVGVKYI